MNTNFQRSGFLWLEQILQDIRFSLRMLRKKPGFTAIAVLSLALAIGVNSGVFSIVNAMLFRPLFPLRPNEVVSVYITEKTAYGYGEKGFTLSEFSLLRESQEVFADVSAVREIVGTFLISTGAETRKSEGLMVSDNYFSMLGSTPSLGRFFLPEESKPNANIPVAVVSRSLWESMGGGNDFSERTVKINGEIYDVVGVAPKEYSGTTALAAPDVWLPMGMVSSFFGAPIPGLGIADYLNISVIARLQPGLTPEAAKSRLTALAPQLAAMEVNTADRTRTLTIEQPSRFDYSAGSSDRYGVIKFLCAFMIGIAGVVLLVACLNLANMFLARNTMRSDELAVRLALGASRRRVVRILSVEGLMVALVGGAAGLVLSHWANKILLASLAGHLSIFFREGSLVLNTTPDIRVLLATLLFCGIATLIFALAPAWRTTRDIARGSFSLQHSTRTTTDRWGRLFSGRHCMLMAQLALSLVLLFIAGGFLWSAMSVARPDLGFEPEGNLVAEIDYSFLDRYEASVRTSITALDDALRSFPDVQKFAFASDYPFEGQLIYPFAVSPIGATGEQGRRAEGIQTAVSRGYFDILGIELLRGRDFTDQECLQVKGPSVVIIDQGTADALFPGEDPVGKYIIQVTPSGPTDLFAPPGADEFQDMGAGGVPPTTTSEPMQIVGVVSAHMDDEFSGSRPLHLFFPLSNKYSQFSSDPIYVIMRGQTAEVATSGTFHELVRSKLFGLDPDIPLVRLTAYSDILEGDLNQWISWFGAVLFGIFGAIALLLATIGVYGVSAFLVARRMREIGVRMALGASRRRIYALLMKQGIVQTAIGLCGGLILTLATFKLMAAATTNFTFSISPGVLGLIVLSALVLALAALLATWLPARRAAKVDPMEVLRWE